jgi:error-prone DNA polymerase
VDGLRFADAERVVSSRPFAWVEDLRSCGAVPVHAIERLAAADAFRSIGLDRRAALWDSKALKQAPELPLFAAADARDEGAEAEPAELPAMALSEHVVNDYQTVRLSLKAHPMYFLRDHYSAQRFVTAGQLDGLRDGRRLSIAGVVLIRQRPGSSKGVVFITIEDETGVANLVIWPDLFERQRKIVMGARLMAVDGIVQKEDGVIHVVARNLEDHTHMLGHLLALPLDGGGLGGGDVSRGTALDQHHPTPRPHQGEGERWRAPPQRHPRDAECIPKSRDFH